MKNRDKVDLYRMFQGGTPESELCKIYKLAPWQVNNIIEEFRADEYAKRVKEDYDDKHRQDIV